MRSDFLANLTSEERQAIFKAAREERERTIQDAIKNGATVQYMTSRLSLDEQETYISMDNEGNCIIDTSIQSDINRCIKRGWKIIHVTYYKDSNQVASMIFKGKSCDISIRSTKE